MFDLFNLDIVCTIDLDDDDVLIYRRHYENILGVNDTSIFSVIKIQK